MYRLTTSETIVSYRRVNYENLVGTCKHSVMKTVGTRWTPEKKRKKKIIITEKMHKTCELQKAMNKYVTLTLEVLSNISNKIYFVTAATSSILFWENDNKSKTGRKCKTLILPHCTNWYPNTHNENYQIYSTVPLCLIASILKCSFQWEKLQVNNFTYIYIFLIHLLTVKWTSFVNKPTRYFFFFS